uniref:Uncharacterized protein n=1 Tax=Setaria italica TaxID=4555 RepID=K3ZYL0_SETIT
MPRTQPLACHQKQKTQWKSNARSTRDSSKWNSITSSAKPVNPDPIPHPDPHSRCSHRSNTRNNETRLQQFTTSAPTQRTSHGI